MSRADILLGKNLSILPFAIVFGMIQAVIVEIAYPMRVMNFLGVLVQLVSMALVYCLLTNVLSVIAPVAQASGSLKPARPRGIPLLLQMTFIFTVFPASMSLTAFPLGISLLLSLTGWLTSVPVFLILALAELGLVVYLYPRVIKLQGDLLQSREQKILEVVTSRVE
jgi:hypothetical protein